MIHTQGLMRMMGWCGIVATCKVNGLFAHLIPQAARADEEVQQARQVMIPNYRLELQASTVTGLATPGLHLHWCPVAGWPDR